MFKLLKKVFVVAVVASLITSVADSQKLQNFLNGSSDEISNEVSVSAAVKSNTGAETKSSDYLTFTVAKKNTVSVPEFDGKTANIEINGNKPFFTTKEKKKTEVFESYSKLDSLGRCGVAYANLCKELMPTEERGDIGSVKPSGWKTSKYDTSIIADRYLFNRCHLIGFQLAGENANKKNLITGTRYLNIEGMLDYENKVAEYVRKTDNHVLYRVTPIFKDDELVCRGLVMEAYSVEDKGKGICFCVFVYNNQPGIEIDYMTGDNWEAGKKPVIKTTPTPAPVTEKEYTYILNTNSKKYHYPDCGSVSVMSNKNKKEYTGTKTWLSEHGYTPCGSCKP